MYKYTKYIWLALGVLFLQIFLLDNISIALFLRPMIFPIIILLLPIEWRAVWVILAAFVVGWIMDLSLGGAGLYIASLLPIVPLRRTLIYIISHLAVESGDQTGLLSRMTQRQMIGYIALALLLHHTLFFGLEALSLATPMQLIGTIVCSTLLSTIVAMPIVRIFAKQLTIR